MNLHLGVSVLLAGLVASGGPLILNPLLMRAGVVDVPNERSSHVRPTLRGGGVSQLAAILVGGLLALLSLGGADNTLLEIVITGACAAGVLGMIEDAIGVSIAIRAVTQFLIGLGMGAVGVQVLGQSWWWLPVVALAFTAYVNFTNFMDGINGISSLHGLVVGATYAALGVALSSEWLLAAGALVAVAFACFLPWNLIPPGLFLGDVGSYLLGGAIASIAIVALLSAAPIIAVIAPLTIYLVDTMTVIVRRMVCGEEWFKPHRGHVYQRLVDGGLSHTTVACLVALFSLVSGILGLMAVLANVPSAVAVWVLLAVLAIMYLGLPRLLQISNGRGGVA